MPGCSPGWPAFAALYALCASRSVRLDAADLRRWLHDDATTTRLTVLDGDTEACAALTRGFVTKMAWLRLASGSVAASLVFSVVAATVGGTR